MKAIVQERYGSPDELELRDVPAPRAGDGEVLVRVRATSIHPDVWHAVTGLPRALRLMGGGLRRPKNPVPGVDVAGVVESIGPGATRFSPGDEVFGQTVGVNLWRNGGTLAELVAVREHLLEPIPANLTFEQAAAVAVSARIALRCVRDEGAVQPGQRVLVNGAGGGVGMFAVQIAKALGAHVTGVDRGDKLDLLRSIGCEEVVDYEREDFTRARPPYDVVIDIPGNRPFSEVRRALTADGSYVLIGHDHFGTQGRRWIGSLGTFAKLLVMSPFVRQLHGLRGSKEPEDALAVIRELVQEGKIVPIVDRAFPLEQVAEAIRYLAEGRAHGKVVITM
jgi:NADPH:quinone reductase-like Zn-dependent oxidoreductase